MPYGCQRIDGPALLLFNDWREKRIKSWDKKQEKQCRANSQREIRVNLWNTWKSPLWIWISASNKCHDLMSHSTIYVFIWEGERDIPKSVICYLTSSGWHSTEQTLQPGNALRDVCRGKGFCNIFYKSHLCLWYYSGTTSVEILRSIWILLKSSCLLWDTLGPEVSCKRSLAKLNVIN